MADPRSPGAAAAETPTREAALQDAIRRLDEAWYRYAKTRDGCDYYGEVDNAVAGIVALAGAPPTADHGEMESR